MTFTAHLYFATSQEVPIVRPTFQGKQEYTVVINFVFHYDRLRLEGGVGEKQLINKYVSLVHHSSVASLTIFYATNTTHDFTVKFRGTILKKNALASGYLAQQLRVSIFYVASRKTAGNITIA